MRRQRPREDEHPNHERWLVSYADFITLLFAFFVVMYAISSVNEGKYMVLSDSLSNAFRSTGILPGGQSVLNIEQQPAAVPKLVDQKKAEQHQNMRKMAHDILSVLQPLVSEGQVRLLETSRGVTIEINDSILFPPGQSKLQPTSITALRAIGRVLASVDFPVTIEGHTDNIPISTPQYPSNWELSALRATTVLRLFNDSGVGAERLTAIGYGETRPVETNTTPEGRARNRRVSILVDSDRPEEPVEVRERRGGEDSIVGTPAAGASALPAAVGGAKGK